MVSSSPPLPEDMFTGPCEKMVMFLNAPFRRDYAALSGLSDERKAPQGGRFPRGVLPRWHNPGGTEHLETPHF